MGSDFTYAGVTYHTENLGPVEDGDVRSWQDVSGAHVKLTSDGAVVSYAVAYEGVTHTALFPKDALDGAVAWLGVVLDGDGY